MFETPMNDGIMTTKVEIPTMGSLLERVYVEIKDPYEVEPEYRVKNDSVIH